jgi:hypothetical protein
MVPQEAKLLYSTCLIPNLTAMIYWDKIEDLLTRSFEGSPFSDGYGPERPIEHTREGIRGELGFTVMHALAEKTDDGSIIGGVFCLPAGRPEDTYDADIGWMCAAPEIGIIQRSIVLQGLITTVKLALNGAGYRRIVTSMGTPAGAKAVSRYGFEHSPTDDMPNRWVSSLKAEIPKSKPKPAV